MYLHRPRLDHTPAYSSPQFPPTSESWKNTDTKLWAGIASFRDNRCGLTLFNMFSKAAYPARITAGVVQQNESGDMACLTTYCNLMRQEVWYDLTLLLVLVIKFAVLCLYDHKLSCDEAAM